MNWQTNFICSFYLFFYANERTLFVYIIHLLWKKMTRKNQRVMAGEHQLLFPPFYIESRRLAIDPGHGLSVLPTMMTTRLVASIKAICVRPARPLTVESTSRRHSRLITSDRLLSKWPRRHYLLDARQHTEFRFSLLLYVITDADNR